MSCLYDLLNSIVLYDSAIDMYLFGMLIGTFTLSFLGYNGCWILGFFRLFYLDNDWLDMEGSWFSIDGILLDSEGSFK